MTIGDAVKISNLQSRIAIIMNSFDNTTQPIIPERKLAHISPQPPRKGGCFGCFGRILILSLLLFAIIIAGGVLVISTLISSSLQAELEEGIERLAAVRNAERTTFETTSIMDRNGAELWEIFSEGKRTFVPISDIPIEVQLATVAVEDDTFYSNKGFDEPSLIAAIIANTRNPDSRPIGGSTITQQIVRHIAFDYEERVAVSYRRKLKELFLAWRMTQDFSKDEILELYLNEIYYGNLAYGVEAASRTYFDKSVRDLTLGEASLLAGLPQSPVGLDPFNNLEGARDRQWFILTLMVEDGIITLDQANAAYLEELDFAVQEASLVAPHFAVYVRQQLEEMYGADEVAGGGLQVTTSIDLGMQALAENLAREHVDALLGNNVTNASLVAIKPGTGEILAMLGSVDYYDEAIDGQVNIATSLQQPGSTIKPLTFAAAISPNPETGEAVWNAAELVWDVPIEYPQFDGSVYRPVNYDERFHGPVRLRSALANSYNIPAVLLLDDIGVERLVTLANQMGIASLVYDPALYGLSLTLGGGEVTPLEMTTAYSVFANGGASIPPVAILKVERNNGEILYEYTPPTPEQVLDPRVAYLISDWLDDDQARIPAMGNGNPLELPFPAAAKTGTTNDFRDNWTLGYTPGLVVGVWTGNTDNSPMVDVSGLSGAAPLWNAFMQGVYAKSELRSLLISNGAQPPTEFVRPSGLTEQSLCRLSSIVPDVEGCDFGRSELILAKDNQPAPTPDPKWEQLEPSVAKVLSAPTGGEWVDGQPPINGFCVLGEGAWPPNTKPRVFLLPPRNIVAQENAAKWATDAGWALLPPSCDGATVAETPTPDWEATNQAWPTADWQPTEPASTPLPTAQIAPPTATPQPTATSSAGAGNSNAGAFWQITSPTAGQTLNGVVSIIGTANFNANTQFYKVEIRRVDRNEWVTLGATHNQAVNNGQLETLSADALINSADWGAGTYEIRLVLIAWDGNFIGQPYVVKVEISE